MSKSSRWLMHVIHSDARTIQATDCARAVRLKLLPSSRTTRSGDGCSNRPRNRNVTHYCYAEVNYQHHISRIHRTRTSNLGHATVFGDTLWVRPKVTISIEFSPHTSAVHTSQAHLCVCLQSPFCSVLQSPELLILFS